jgi:predicted transcriptional regulator
MDTPDLRGEHANLVKTLLRKRRDIAFHVTEIERQAEAVRADLVHIDAVIRMFAPDIAPDALPKRERHPRRLDYFAHGEITRRIYDMMRGGGTVAAIAVAKRAIEEKGLSFEDRRVRTEFCRRITMQLNHMRRERKVEKIGMGRGVKWKLAKEPESGI